MQLKNLVVPLLAILIGLIIFVFPFIPLLFILIGAIFPFISFINKESPFKSLIYIFVSLISCYVIAPLLLHEKFLPTIADTVSFPEDIGTALVIGFVFASIPYLGTSFILQIIKNKKHKQL